MKAEWPVVTSPQKIAKRPVDRRLFHLDSIHDKGILKGKLGPGSMIDVNNSVVVLLNAMKEIMPERKISREAFYVSAMVWSAVIESRANAIYTERELRNMKAVAQNVFENYYRPDETINPKLVETVKNLLGLFTDKEILTSKKPIGKPELPEKKLMKPRGGFHGSEFGGVMP